MTSRRRILLPSAGHVDENGMITDSWDTFIKSVKSGKARKYYSIGDYIPLDLGEHGLINMQIILFDPMWPNEDRTGYPNVALFGKECLNDEVTWGSLCSLDGKTNFDRNRVFNETIYSCLPEEVKRAIVSVYKPYGIRNGNHYLFGCLASPFKTWSITTGLDIQMSLASPLDLNTMKDIVYAKRNKADGTETEGCLLFNEDVYSTSSSHYFIAYGLTDSGVTVCNKWNHSSPTFGYPVGFCI